MKTKERKLMREKKVDELRKDLQDREKELVSLRFEQATGKLKDVMRVGKKRDEIAVIKTIIREKELMEERND